LSYETGDGGEEDEEMKKTKKRKKKKKKKKRNQSTILKAIVGLRCTIAARLGRKTSLGCSPRFISVKRRRMKK